MEGNAFLFKNEDPHWVFNIPKLKLGNIWEGSTPLGISPNFLIFLGTPDY